MEVVRVNGYFVVNSGQTVSLAQSIRDEGRVADTFRQIALTGRKNDDMVEIKVARFQYTHDLNAFSWFAMERDAGGLHELQYKSLQGNDVDDEVASVDELVKSIEQSIGAEERLLEEWVFDFACLCAYYFLYIE